MKKIRLEAQPLGLFFWALVYFFLPEKEAAALLVPVAVHELGHLAALRLCGVEIYAIILHVTGLKINCSTADSASAELLIAGAGCAAGLMLWAVLSICGVARLAAGVSLLLSLFNLMPVYPLDGGRLVRIALSSLFVSMKGEKVQRLVGDIFCCTLLGVSFYMLLCGIGAGLFVGACMCLLASLRED